MKSKASSALWLFASRYKLHLPSEAELRAELRREVKALAAPRKHGDAQ